MVYYCSEEVQNEKHKSHYTFRPFTIDNMSLFRDQLRSFSWNNVLREQDVNNALDQFLDTFTTLFELYFPEKKRKINKNRDSIKQFMTKGLLISRNRKNLLFKKKISSPTVENINNYRIYRNIYNSVLRRSKKLYFETALAKFKSKPKKIWEIINQATGSSNPKSKITEILVNGQTVDNDKAMAMAFNEHFSNVGTEIVNEIQETNVDPISYLPENPNVPDFSINNTGPSHVIDVVKVMQCKSSSDCNHISMKLVKFVIYEIAVPLAHIFQRSIETGVFPEKFKKSRVVPIFKCGDVRNCDNYRPIALVNTFSKILEKMVATDLYNHLDINNLIYKHQYGFQRHKSTEHNLIQITNYIGQAINEGKWCIGIFLDLKKAFDTVQHDILLKKLHKLGVKGVSFNWFKSYLSERLQCVDINGSLSDFNDILMSVLQGSALGPILFLCFINDIYLCTNLNLFLFADDTNALTKGDNLPELIDYVNSELQKIALWLQSNKLSVNTSKTKYIIFRTKNRNINLNGKDIYMDFNLPDLPARPELKVKLTRVSNDCDVSNQTYKLLGVMFDEYLSFKQHVAFVQRKLSKSLYLLNRAKNFLTPKALRLLYFATVHSHLMYCPIIISICNKTDINKLFIMQKKAIRIICGKKFHEHTPPLFVNSNIMPLDMIIKCTKLKLMHSVRYNYCPKSFIDCFTRNDIENQQYELRFPQDFEIPRARIEFFKRIPCYSLCVEWNNCENLCFYSNPTTFRIELLNTLFYQYALENGLVGE
jgi:hypothetical protein